MNGTNLLVDVLFVAGVVLFLMGVFASRLPEPFRRHKRRLLIGGLVVALALPALDIAFNWTEAVEHFKAERATAKQK